MDSSIEPRPGTPPAAAGGRAGRQAKLRWPGPASPAERHPVGVFVAITYGLSLLAAVVIYGPALIGGDSVGAQALRSLVMFPVMVIGVGVAGYVLTRVVAGQPGRVWLRERMRRWRLGGWWALAGIAPGAIVVVLEVLHNAVSSVFAPSLNLFGLAAGVLAGFFEEIGWTGYAWPRLRDRLRTPLLTAVLFGIGWALWHLPVVDHLGVRPHGGYWTVFMLAFVAAITALRVLIIYGYSRTGSVLLAQAVHASSTGGLVLLSPLAVSPAQEALWYAGYAVLLWIVVAILVFTGAFAHAIALDRTAEDPGRVAPT